MGILKGIKLKNFRNYSNQEAVFERGINVITGYNGQGKTNLLEAVYYLSLLRSFRTNRIKDIIKSDTSFFYLSGLLLNEKSNSEERLTVINGTARQLKINNTLIRRASDFICRFFCVACAPQDIFIIKGSPSERRRFVDIILCQTVPGYLDSLGEFSRALKSRNAMLKQPYRYSEKAITAYDDILIRRGADIITDRIIFTEKFDFFLKSISPDLFGKGMNLTLSYLPAPALPESYFSSNRIQKEEVGELYRNILDDRLERDIGYGNTSCGPHRDDFSFKLNDKELTVFGSEGQCRLSALVIKLATAELFRGFKGNKQEVCLLVDDVFGELDRGGIEKFTAKFTDFSQVILACTEMPAGLEKKVEKLLRVNNGVLT